MDVATILLYMFPDAIPLIDYQVGDDGSGPRIVSWSYAGAPEPTVAQLQANAAKASGSAQWGDLQVSAKAALDTSDIAVIRCAEHGVAVPAEWVAYRAALRVIVSADTGNATAGLPVRPAYPAGT